MFPPYPQHSFFRFFRRYIPAEGPGFIVDGPCGSGYISNCVADDLPSKKIMGIDIDEASIAYACKTYHGDNLDFKVQDIHAFLDTCGEVDVYLLINSIFLLPRPVEILKKIYDKLSKDGKLVIVIPNAGSANFKNFQQINPAQNTLILDKKEAAVFFEKIGFRIETIKGLGFTTVYGNRLLSKLWKLRGFYTYGLDTVNRLRGAKPSYWGFILAKI